MNSRNTWRWIVVAAGLFAFIFFYQRHVDKPGGGPVRVLPKLKAAAVTSVQVRPAAHLDNPGRPHQRRLAAHRTAGLSRPGRQHREAPRRA